MDVPGPHGPNRPPPPDRWPDSQPGDASDEARDDLDRPDTAPRLSIPEHDGGTSFEPDPATPTDGPPPDGRPRIVIVGGGFGGAYAAARFEKCLQPNQAEVVLIDRNNYMVFQPLLVEAGTGDLEPRHAVVGLRSYLRRTRFRMGEVIGLDTREQVVRYRPAGTDTERSLYYDHVVLAPGSRTKLPPVPGLAEYGFELKTLHDAVGLRDRAIAMLEMADATDNLSHRRALLHLVVVGGNYTGVEVAGEFQEFMRSAARQYPNLSPRDCRVTLVEIQQRILPTLDRELADYAMEQISRRGIQVLLKTSIARIEGDHCILSDGRRLDSNTVIWAAGIAPPALVGSLNLPLDERGYILCTRDLRVAGYSNVWAIGDAAVNVDAEGNAYPATAQHAIAEGEHAADNIAASLRNEPVTPFNYTSKGMLAPLGARTAVAKIRRFKLSGVLAWWLWRTFYLMRMPGLSRRIRVAIDWTLEALFRHEYVQLGIHRPTRERERRSGERDRPAEARR